MDYKQKLENELKALKKKWYQSKPKITAFLISISTALYQVANDNLEFIKGLDAKYYLSAAVFVGVGAIFLKKRKDNKIKDVEQKIAQENKNIDTTKKL